MVPIRPVRSRFSRRRNFRAWHIDHFENRVVDAGHAAKCVSRLLALHVAEFLKVVKNAPQSVAPQVATP